MGKNKFYAFPTSTVAYLLKEYLQNFVKKTVQSFF